MINESLKHEGDSNQQKLREYERMYLDVIKSQSEQLKNYQKQTENLLNIIEELQKRLQPSYTALENIKLPEKEVE